MKMTTPQTANAADLLERYPAIVLDSYGVLVHHGGTFPGACDFVARLNEMGKRFVVLTNDASRLPEQVSQWYAREGLAIPAERIVTSGSLLTEHFAGHGLVGARCAVLGTEDSKTFVRMAGGEVVPLDGVDIDAVVVCDDAGYPLLETLDNMITAIIARATTNSTSVVALQSWRVILLLVYEAVHIIIFQV